MWKQIKTTLLFTTASENDILIYNLDIHLTKHVQELYAKHDEMWVKEIEADKFH